MQTCLRWTVVSLAATLAPLPASADPHREHGNAPADRPADSKRHHHPTHHAAQLCGNPQAILSVPDVDGSGVVDGDDLLMLGNAVDRRQYYAFYDVNGDGKLNRQDVKWAELEMGMPSSSLDQSLAALFHRTKQFQLVDSEPELRAMGYQRFTSSLAGHGEHWVNTNGIAAVLGREPSRFDRAEGVNVSQDSDTVPALFWGQAAVPVFENGATDFPTPGGAWEEQRVIAFAGEPPQFTSSAEERWHTHAGLCITAEASQDGPLYSLHQHTTFAQCQALPSVLKTEESPLNPWINIWMLHVWLFDLNPEGVFANTHPCIDPDAPDEHTINEGRPVPPFFQHHG